MLNRRNIIIVAIILIAIVAWLNRPRQSQSKTVAPVAVSNAPRTDIAVTELVETADSLLKDRQLAKAKDVYQNILNNHSDYENIENIQGQLEKINMELIFSNAESPETKLHEVQSGDTLGELAKQYGTTVELIKRKNHLKSDIIRVGQKLRIWNKQFNIYVDKSQNMLFLKNMNDVVKVYRVSTGKDNNTPVGEFLITTKLEDPVWFNRGVVVPPESPENVLGSRWLGFDLPGYGIRGTIEPKSIGKQVTAGCVRMRNEDVEELYSMIPTGTKVVIVD